MKKRTKALLILLALLLLLTLPGFYNGLAFRRYTVEAPGVTGPVRIALVTDLHSCAYGEGQRELLDAIDAQAPDLILLSGDIFDDGLPDDNAETFFLNFLRGTGTRGLRGMSAHGRILRPLLGISREEIRSWMEANGKVWREDSTNASSAYKRNRLRHEVIPVLREMNPSLPDSFRRAMEHIAQVDDIAEDYFLSVRDSVCSGGLVSVKALLALKHARYVLFRLAEPVGLTETALDNLWDLLCSGRHLAGKVFVGKSGEIRGLAKWRLQIVVFDKSC